MKVKARRGYLGNELEDAHVAFEEVGGGLFICTKDRSGEFNDGLYTSKEVKEHFKGENKVLIQVRGSINKFGNYILTPISNFEPLTQ